MVQLIHRTAFDKDFNVFIYSWLCGDTYLRDSTFIPNTPRCMLWTSNIFSTWSWNDDPLSLQQITILHCYFILAFEIWLYQAILTQRKSILLASLINQSISPWIGTGIENTSFNGILLRASTFVTSFPVSQVIFIC